MTAKRGRVGVGVGGKGPGTTPAPALPPPPLAPQWLLPPQALHCLHRLEAFSPARRPPIGSSVMLWSFSILALQRCRSPSPRPHDLGEGWAAAPCPTFYSQIPQPDCVCSQPLSLTLYLQTSRQTGLAQQLGRISREIHRDKKLVPADARLRAPFIEQNEMVTF